MPSRHQVDLSTRFTYHKRERASRAIEKPDLDPVPEGMELARNQMAKVVREPYVPSKPLEDAVNLAIALGRPLLLQGDPGAGKTRLAHAVAYSLGLPLEECYIKSTSRAQDLLYTYDAVSRLYDVQLPPPQHGAPTGSSPEPYVHYGGLGRAIIRASYGRRSVVLIDEIDKADLDFPNDLLRELDGLEFEVRELGGKLWRAAKDRPDLRPIVIVTHNEEKPLPGAFLRRCVYHFVEFPKDKTFLEDVLAAHGVGGDGLGARAVDVLLTLRKLELQKRPGLSELLDWVGYLDAVSTDPEALADLPYAGALIKNADDLKRVKPDPAR